MINYDQMGNPTNYVSKDLSENDVTGVLEYDGRQLVKSTNGSEGYEYIYNENGLMTKKLVYENYDIDSNGKLIFSDLQSTYTYYWDDSKLMGYTLVNSSDGSFFNVKVMYGADGEPSGYTITGDNDFEMGFVYTKNLQGDITGIYTLEGTSCLLFSYDAYGIPAYTVGDSFIGAWLSLVLNPLLYRGYMYDTNTGLYYLQSRHYNPIYGRFLNADETMMLHFTQGEVLSVNLYGYCYNNPINRIDPMGYASYKNTITKSGSNWNIKTVINILGVNLTYNYIISWDGVIRFNFTKNVYWSVLWRGGGRVLAEAMFKAARSLSRNFLKGRTIGGIHTELLLHWVAWVTIGISNAKIADMGSMIKVTSNGKVINGFDSNALIWEGANAIWIIKRLNIWKPWGIVSLIRDIARYFR